MKVLVLNTPFLPKFSRSSRSPAVTKGGTLYFPLWLSYATGVLEKEGHNVKLLDAPAKEIGAEKVVKLAKKFNPDLVVADTATASIESDMKLIGKLGEKTGAHTCAVGTHVSALTEESMKIDSRVNSAARHEYDYTVRDLAAELEKKKPNLKTVDGLSFRKGKKLVNNKNRKLIENLDELPFVSEVYKKHLKIEDYFYSANLWPEVTIISGRGCPYRCTFCVLPQVMNGRSYRYRSVDNVIREFEYIKEAFPQAKEIFIEDDTLPANRIRIRELSKELVKRKVGMPWSCNSRADVDLETLKSMKKAGCRLLCVGFESGEQKILNEIHKGTRIETIRQFMKDTKKAGILVHGCFMLGNQGETKETIRTTIEFAKELNPDTAQFFPIMVYPGTETYEWAKKNKFLVSENFSDWLDGEGNHNCMVSRPELTAKELVAGCDEARRQFYLRPNYIASKALQALTQPKEIPRILKSTKRFYRFLMNSTKRAG